MEPDHKAGCVCVGCEARSARLRAESVNNPPHYQAGGLEAIDVIESFDLGFHLGNAVKYVLRAGRKGDAIEDLEKSIWYLRRDIERRKAEKKTTT